jgi:hypothetical protein
LAFRVFAVGQAIFIVVKSIPAKLFERKLTFAGQVVATAPFLEAGLDSVLESRAWIAALSRVQNSVSTSGAMTGDLQKKRDEFLVGVRFGKMGWPAAGLRRGGAFQVALTLPGDKIHPADAVIRAKGLQFFGIVFPGLTSVISASAREAEVGIWAIFQARSEVGTFSAEGVAEAVAAGGAVGKPEAKAPGAIFQAVVEDVALSALGIANPIAATNDRLAEVPNTVAVFIALAWIGKLEAIVLAVEDAVLIGIGLLA